MTQLVIAGHGKQRNRTFDPGATGFITKGEHKYVVDDLFPAMKKHLPKGHDVVFFDKYKVSNYGNIVALAKEYKAKQITEIHFDASGNPSARGGHVIVHSNFSPDKTDLALRDAIKKVVGVRYSHKGHDGISGRNNLLNVNQTAKAGITYRLIELGFGTNKEDAAIMTGQVDEYAKELVKAITGSVVEQASKPVVKPTPSKPVVNKPAAKPKANLTVDGYWGVKLTKAWQTYFGLVSDGEIWGQVKNSVTSKITGGVKYGKGGSPLIRAIQKLVGAVVDGILGKETIRKLQVYLGTPVDGELWSPSAMVKELQRRLNKGKL